MDLPKIINVIITKELLESSGTYGDYANCPYATFMRSILGDQVLDVGVHSISIKTTENHYWLDKGFTRQEYDKVKYTGISFEAIATLRYYPKL